MLKHNLEKNKITAIINGGFFIVNNIEFFTNNKFVKEEKMTKVKKSLLILPLLIALLLTALMVSACGEPADKSTHVGTLTELETALQNGGAITLDKNIEDVNKVLMVTKDVSLNLNGKTISSADALKYKEGNTETEGTWSLFVVRGGTLTVNGDGTIDAKNLFTFSVQSKYESGSASATKTANADIEASKLVIENGTFKSGDVEDEATVVYVIGAGSSCEIKGGNFSVSTDDKTWVLNTEDASETKAGHALISVTGGTFENFNPAAVGPSGSHDTHSHVASGYEAKKIDNTNNYEVVKTENK